MFTLVMMIDYVQYRNTACKIKQGLWWSSVCFSWGVEFVWKKRSLRPMEFSRHEFCMLTSATTRKKHSSFCCYKSCPKWTTPMWDSSFNGCLRRFLASD